MEMIIVLASLYIGYRIFKKEGESLFYKQEE